MLEVIGKGWSFAMLTARLCNPGVRRKRAKVAITSAIKFQGMTILLGTVAISVPGMGTLCIIVCALSLKIFRLASSCC